MSRSQHSSSQNSKFSNYSNKMHSRASEVDETLFGKKGPKKDNNQNCDQYSLKSNQYCDTLEIEKIKRQVFNGDFSHPDVIVLSQKELQNLKKEATILTKAEQLQQKKLLEEQKEKQQAAQIERKQKMLKIEEDKKSKIPLTDIQKAEKAVQDQLKHKAARILQEQIDDVKEMNKMVMYGQCVTVRDKQLEERQCMREQMKVDEKRKDLMMEIDRLKKIKFYEEQEQQKKQSLIKGHMEIIEQIKEREMIRLREKEEQEIEGQQIVRQVKQMEKEQQEIDMRKKKHQKDILDQIYDANRQSILMKEKKKLFEKEEEEKIIQYNKEKAQKELELLVEQKRLKDEKEKEIQKLRDLQEKESDRNAELDALRAKRQQENNERQAREKERKVAELKKIRNQELLEAREQQMEQKKKQQAEQAKQERDEFQRIIQAQQLARETEIKKDLARKEILQNHSNEILKQILEKEEKKQQSIRNMFEEGRQIKEKIRAHEALLSHIKQEKLDQMASDHIQAKYMAELAKKKIGVK